MTASLFLRRLFPVAGLAFLVSCTSSSRPPAGSPEAAATAPASTRPVEEKSLRRAKPAAPEPLRPVSLDAPETVPPSAKPSRPAPPSRRDQIVRLVRDGNLIESSSRALIFAVTGKPAAAPGGLFEDAIVLNRLRGGLKKIPNLPAQVPGSATVASARAYLQLGDTIPPEVAARAIDAALRTEGITAVQATLAEPVRM